VPWQDPPPQQPMTVEVLKSVERPEHSRTFGTRLPPRGLSGAMRRAAFRRSEDDIGHWLMWVAADRVDVAGSMVRALPRSPRRLAALGAGIAGVAALAWWRSRDWSRAPERRRAPRGARRACHGGGPGLSSGSAPA